MIWSWDQGRLQYFQFDNLKAIAHTLAQFDNVQIDSCEPVFRQQLENNTGMPFAPKHYTVLRNYKRVFESSLLATVVSGRLQCTDICHEMAKTDSSLGYVDEYFSLYIPRFRYPSPAFKNYAQTSHRVYPFCAVLKYLIARLEHSLEPRISVNDTLNILIANDCTGYEDSNYFLALTPKTYNNQDEKRQVREMLIFMSQMSILKMYKEHLYLEVVWSDEIAAFLRKISTPFGTEPWEDEKKEFLNQSQMDATTNVLPIMSNILYSDDIGFVDDVEFPEGKRTRVEHLKIERSPLLREYYMRLHPEPVCQMCNIHMSQRYPWTIYLLEIHHLLPLSSALAISKKGTSLNGVVGLCPSCHRGLHNYYKQWLDKRRLKDFPSKEEVESVYQEAKGSIKG